MAFEFVEPILRLPPGRWCYQPVPFAPEVAPCPQQSTGRITFGSFNNTAKYHAGVFALWVRMQGSALMDAVGFARGLEEALIGLYRRIEGLA